MGRVLEVIRRRLVASGLVTLGQVHSIPSQWKAMFGVEETAAFPLQDVSYIDDCAFPIFSKAANLCGKVARRLV